MLKSDWRRAVPNAIIVGLGLSIFMPRLAMAADIETVVVTAEKRSENVQKIPVAITAVGGGQLAQQGIRQPTDLNRIVPSLSESQLPGSSTAVNFDIRGQVASDILLNI